MRLLFDYNVPAPLRHLLPDHDIHLAGQVGWGELSNGKLLLAAEQAGFEMLITADKNLRYQQNLAGRKIAIVVLPTQHMATLQEGIEQVASAIKGVLQGSFVELELPRRPLLRRPQPQDQSP